MTHEKLGADLREFFRGFLFADQAEEPSPPTDQLVPDEAADAPPDAQPSDYEYRGLTFQPVLPEKPRSSDIAFMPNARAKLRSGWLLLGVQKDNSVYQWNPETGDAELVCRFLNTPMLLWRASPLPDGTFYVTMSGTRWPGHPDEVAFGQGGVILHIDHRNESMTVVPGSDQLQDPSELLVEESGSLLVADFQGFGGTGAIYRIDPATGNRQTILSGEPLKEPVALAVTPNGMYICNAFMEYSHAIGPGGQRVKEFGAILQIPAAAPAATASALKVVMDESNAPLGVLDSIGFETHDHRYAIVTRNDWPTQEGGAILQWDTVTGVLKPILTNADSINSGATVAFARVEQPNLQFAHAADSYGKRMFKIDIAQGEIVDTKPLTDILGPTVGMVSPLETVESLRPIP